MRSTAFLTLLALLASPTPAAAASGHPAEPKRSLDLIVDLQSIVVYRNDRDFDRTEAAYEPGGQSVGFAATYFKPFFRLGLSDELSIVYELEVGLNVWSRNNADQQDPQASDVFLMKHRQIYAAGDFKSTGFGFKVGYQRLTDPTGLFVDHWIGAADLYWRNHTHHVSLIVGQIPDPVAEGVPLESNNFVHDTTLYALRYDISFTGCYSLDLGAYHLEDRRVVAQKLDVYALLAHFAARWPMDGTVRSITLEADAALQAGTHEAKALGREDQDQVAYAGQLSASLSTSALSFSLNLLLLSADDASSVNTENGAFYFSGKSRSKTMMLSESEIRDTYDNLDERLFFNSGAFYLTRPGLLLADLEIAWRALEGRHAFTPALIAAHGIALEADNALGETSVGTELDLDLRYVFESTLEAHLTASVLLPGGALAAHANLIDKGQTEPVVQVLSSLGLRY